MINSSSVRSLLVSLFFALQAILLAPANSATLEASATKGHHVKQSTRQSSYLQRHPKVKSATVGAGLGAVAGGATGLLTGRGVLRGAAIGAGTGAGVGLIRSSHTMRAHPIAKDVATGTAAGLGLGWAAGRRHSTVKAGALGAAAGLGVGLFKHAQ